MATIFLSYAREDAAKAKRIADALEDVGHSVWWDRHLHAGSRFTAEIDRALKSADVVVVLWSKSSIESAWVQDEAAAGRDTGRLIPVLIGKVEPPLGFRQYQAIELSGGRAPELQRLVSAVNDRVGAAAPETCKRRASPRPWKKAAAMAALLLLALGGGLYWWLNSRVAPQSLLVAASDAQSIEIAKVIAADLASFKVGPLAGLDVRADRGTRTRYKTEIRLVRAGSQSELRVTFGPRTAPALWTSKFTGAQAQEQDLRIQATQQLGAVLACAIDPKVSAAHLSNQLLGPYLNSCAQMANFADQMDPAVIENLRQVTLEAPKFAPAWGQLELALYRALITAPASEDHDLALETRGAWRQAAALDPRMPQNFVVDAFVNRQGPGYIPNALTVVERGLKLNPDSALLLSTRADLLTSVGRIKDAFDSANEAIWRDPLSPNLLGSHVMLLVYIGEKREAEAELTKAERKWPGSSAIRDLRWAFDLRYGDPAEALRLLRQRQEASNRSSSMQLYLEARADPTPAKIDAALEASRADFRANSGAVLQLIQALATFGRNDEVYQALAAPETLDDMSANSDVLFRPYFAGVRKDPRFIELANRIGLLAYWRKAKVWPDFCSDPQLPYDCRKEAEKYR